MPEIKYLMEQVVVFREARGWSTGHTAENLAKSISIEASELLELFQWHPPTTEELIEEGTLRTRVCEELADIMIYALSFADRAAIDPAQAIIDKLSKNALKYPLENTSLE